MTTGLSERRLAKARAAEDVTDIFSPSPDEDDMPPIDWANDVDRLAALQRGESIPVAEIGGASYSPAEIANAWAASGPLVRMPTGFATIDEACRGGIPTPWRWGIIGAPSAGKTFLAKVIASRFIALGGVFVVWLAVDEDPDDITIRAAQEEGFTVEECERRDPIVMQDIARRLEGVPLRLYGSEWTIEAAVADGEKRAPAGSRIVVVLDSIQTVRSEAGALAESKRELVVANVAATRVISRKHLVIFTSEANRGAYANDLIAASSSGMAAAKESGDIEFACQTFFVLSTPKGHANTVHVKCPKNRRGAKGQFELWLSIDRHRHRLTECANPQDGDADVKEDHSKRANHEHARVVQQIVLGQPGIGTKNLRGAVMAELGIGREKADVAITVAERSGLIENRPETRGTRDFDHYFAVAKGGSNGEKWSMGPPRGRHT